MNSISSTIFSLDNSGTLRAFFRPSTEFFSVSMLNSRIPVAASNLHLRSCTPSGLKHPNPSSAHVSRAKLAVQKSGLSIESNPRWLI